MKRHYNNLSLSETTISWDYKSIEMDEEARESWTSSDSVNTSSMSSQNEYKLDMRRMNSIWSWRHSKIVISVIQRLDDILSARRDTKISYGLILSIFESVLLDQIRTCCHSSHLPGSPYFSMICMRTVTYEKIIMKSLILVFFLPNNHEKTFFIDLISRILKRDLFTLFFFSIDILSTDDSLNSSINGPFEQAHKYMSKYYRNIVHIEYLSVCHFKIRHRLLTTWCSWGFAGRSVNEICPFDVVVVAVG